MFPALYVTKVTLVGIAFALKGDGSVSLVPVSDHQQPDDKLYHVEQVEPDNQQFFFLLPMNVLVVDVLITHHESFTDEYHIQDGDRLIPTRGNDVVIYYLHNSLIFTILLEVCIVPNIQHTFCCHLSHTVQHDK